MIAQIPAIIVLFLFDTIAFLFVGWSMIGKIIKTIRRKLKKSTETKTKKVVVACPIPLRRTEYMYGECDAELDAQDEEDGV
jgi:hypothetical protein